MSCVPALFKRSSPRSPRRRLFTWRRNSEGVSQARIVTGVHQVPNWNRWPAATRTRLVGSGSPRILACRIQLWRKPTRVNC